MTLTDLKEAQKTFSLSGQDREKEEGDVQDDTASLRGSLTEDREEKAGLKESTEPAEISLKWSKMDEVT